MIIGSDGTVIPQMVEAGVLELIAEIYSSETDESLLVCAILCILMISDFMNTRE